MRYEYDSDVPFTGSLYFCGGEIKRMTVTNPISLAVCALQVTAGVFECTQGRWYLAMIWFGVSIASFAMGVIK